MNDFGSLFRFLDSDEFAPSTLVDSVIRPFAPTFALELIVVALYVRRRLLRQDSERGCSMSPLLRCNQSGLWLLPLQVWCLQASLRGIEFFDMLAWSHGPEPEEGLAVLFHSLLALGMLLLVQEVAAAGFNQNFNSLGLNARHRSAFIYALLAIVLDAFLLQTVARWPIVE